MSAATFAPTPTANSTSDFKQQQRHQQQRPQEQHQQYEDNDDDISLARFMSRKSQLNQQMPAMYPWMSPNFMTLQPHQQDPWKEKDTTPIDYYGHNVSYAHYQQLQYQQQQQQQHQLILQQCQKQKQMGGYNGLPQKTHHHHHTSGTNHRSTGRKTRPAPADTHHDAKTRMSPSSPAPRVRSSTLNSSSSSSLATNASHSQQQQQQQQQRQRSSSPVPSLVDDSGTWRSSIYSHTSAASSSVKTTSDTTSFNNAPIHSSASSISSFSMSTSGGNNKPSLSKRIRGVFSGANKQHYDSYSPTLRRSPSMVSCASSVMTTNTVSSTKSSWTRNLFRKSSKCVSISSGVEGTSTNQKNLSVHAETSNVVAPASPASSISGRSQRHSTLQPKNGFVADLPSPASSSSITVMAAAADTSSSSSSRRASLLSSSSFSNQQQQRHGNKQIRSPKIDSSSSQQQDYFGLPSSRHMTRPTFLQHGSPGLRPSSKSNNASLVSEEEDDDDVSTCMMAPSSNVGQQQQGSDGRKQTKMAPLTSLSSCKKGARTRFNTTIQVHDTFGSKDYDRRCDTQVTCQRLTPVLALQIKQELNEYKLNEMAVHPSSRQYTQFFL